MPPIDGFRNARQFCTESEADPHDLWPDAGDDTARPHANEIIRKSRGPGRIHGVTVKAAHNAG
jgi:hypothetical protein